MLVNEPVERLDEAISHVIVWLAGEAAARVAFAVGMLSDLQIGADVVPETELDAELLASGTNGRTPTARAVSHTAYVMPSDIDDENARATAEEWTGDALEAQALLGFCWRRLANMAETPMFQRSVHRVADMLLEQGGLTGQFVRERVLDRMAGMTGRTELIKGRKR
jgi:hypothetical protein